MSFLMCETSFENTELPSEKLFWKKKKNPIQKIETIEQHGMEYVPEQY